MMNNHDLLQLYEIKIFSINNVLEQCRLLITYNNKEFEELKNIIRSKYDKNQRKERIYLEYK